MALTAEQVKVVKVADGEIKIDLDGDAEVISLNDLADGQERSFGSGEHQVTVRREGDQLKLELDGEEILTGAHACCPHHAASTVLLAGDDEEHEIRHKGSTLTRPLPTPTSARPPAV